MSCSRVSIIFAVLRTQQSTQSLGPAETRSSASAPYISEERLRTLKSWVGELLLEPVQRFRALQGADGSVVAEREYAQRLLAQIVERSQLIGERLGCESFTEAFATDMKDWARVGLGSPPDAARTRNALHPPLNQELGFFIGPTLAQNGPAPRGMFLEFFLVLRHEPEAAEELKARHPHPLNPTQATRLLTASRGFGYGNCVVFFPEYISAPDKIEKQSYAIFFFNKFIRIYLTHTMPTVRASFGARDAFFGTERWVSEDLEPEFTYSLRCIWGFLHDYYHHRGPRPLHLNLQLKQEWHASVLEELKADCQVALTAARDAFVGWQHVFEFVLLDRMFRYPGQPDRATNFDAATGVLLFEWLRAQGGLRTTSEGRLGFDFERTLEGLDAFVNEVEQIEAEGDDQRYLANCRSMVRRYVHAAEDDQGCALPEAYTRWVRLQEQTLVPMTDLPY